MYSLFIDTHDKNVLIILFKDGKIILKEDVVSANKHSQVTLPTISKVLGLSNIDVKELGEIIVVNGPGSFTGERIAVTIAKTMAYTLNIPIKVIDSLVILAINIKDNEKIVALEDRNGAFVGKFNKYNEKLEDYIYLNNSLYQEFKKDKNVITNCIINYEYVYQYISKLNNVNPHSVKPLYIKGISVLNDK